MSRRTLVALTAVAVLAGCTPTTATRQGPASPRDAGESAPARDCSRQFDENDAGFQTCVEGAGEEP
jgi:Prokaryotic membrane lipoprotein lipid attachment site